jgi:hypothetical protein
VVTRAGSKRKQTGGAEIAIIDIRVRVARLQTCSASRHSSAACFVRAI